jgi:transcriptional antiterminator RfaH
MPALDPIQHNGGHWYAIHTKPRQEYLVRELLEGRGIATYLPALRVKKRRSPHSRGERSFFANYLFASMDLSVMALSSVNWAPGVNRVVQFGGQPAIVPGEVIAWLRDRLALIQPEDYHQGLPLHPGDRLRVTKGPLKDMEAVFDQRLSSGQRARVFIEMLGRLTACQVDLQDLQRVAGPVDATIY